MSTLIQTFLNLVLFGIFSCSLSPLLADDHIDSTKSSGKQREAMENQHRELHDKLHNQEKKIHQAIHEGDLSNHEGHQKLKALHKEFAQKQKQLHFKMIRADLEKAVKSGRMTREEAEERKTEFQERMVLKEEITKELEEEMQETLEELKEAVEEGELSNEEARTESEVIRRNLGHEIRMAHMEIELDAEESRLDQAVEEGEIDEDEAGQRLGKMREKMERMEFEFHERMSRFEEHHSNGEHNLRAHWEDEDELWELVSAGMKAAVRLGKMSEEEAREIWYEWREEEEYEEDEEEDNDEED